ncbi:hypothetical protein [Cryobacterium sp. GrIS_2_6]|uniref:hypothetical protein n=1 Tax=Cryobacterium sp. GrIS_2_6 TaxID=3162785 RepID=UPI002DF89DFD|nr:hypothetical protein [Cryobacterium psychrotolerans]
MTVAVLLTLSGCVGTTPSSSSSPDGSNTASALTRGPNPAPPKDDAAVAPVPEAAAASQTAAIAAAEKAVTAFGQPGLRYRAWIDGLYPLMTQAGAAAYEGTDPVNVPVHHVTGAGMIHDGSTEFALIVQVPTDAGLYNVSLSRTSPTAPWLADRIRPAGA